MDLDDKELKSSRVFFHTTIGYRLVPTPYSIFVHPISLRYPQRAQRPPYKRASHLCDFAPFMMAMALSCSFSVVGSLASLSISSACTSSSSLGSQWKPALAPFSRKSSSAVEFRRSSGWELGLNLGIWFSSRSSS